MGTVYLIGAGPGDPGLLTLRGARALRDSDAVVYDALANDELLAMAPAKAARFDVGKRAGGRGPSQRRINRLLAGLARECRVVARLKGGDPCVFGRGGEEALALEEAGVPFEIVPGVTSGLGVPTYAGIPVTHRGLSSSVTLLTGHQATEGNAAGIDWDALARLGGTVVVYMGLSRIDAVAERLLDGGRPPGTPAAVIECGTYAEQRTLVGDLASIAELSRAADAGRPALIIIGEVVKLSRTLGWFGRATRKAPESPESPEATGGRPPAREPARSILELPAASGGAGR